MSVESTISEKLHQHFSPQILEIINESSMHAGHAGSPGTGESHFRVYITSDVFSGVSRVARHRMIYQLLQEEIDGPIHALAIEAYTHEEHLARQAS